MKCETNDMDGGQMKTIEKSEEIFQISYVILYLAKSIS